MVKVEGLIKEPCVDSYGISKRSGMLEFQQIGLAAFLDTDNDIGVDWEECFGLTPEDGGKEMQALRITQDVAPDGFLHIAVPPEMSRRCEVIVLPIYDSQETKPTTYNTAKMQEQSGFVQQVLGAASEDVWNDL